MLWLIFAAIAAYIMYTQVYQPWVFWKKRGVPYATPFPFVGNALRTILRMEAMADMLVRLYNEFPGQR